MAKKISQLTQATEVKSDDVTVIVQDGETKKLPLNMMVTKQDIENKKVAGLAKLDEIEATYENDTYTPTITVKNKSSVKVGEGDGVDYSANVMDGHVKSAILTGNTLVNLLPNDNFIGSASNRGQRFILTQPLIMNKTYLLIVNVTKDDTIGGWHCRFTDGVNYPTFETSIKGVGLKKIKFTPTINLPTFFPYFELADCNEGRFVILENMILVEYQAGMENWDIPYFTGMQSVKLPVLTTTGKNLFPDINFSNNHIYKKVANGIQIIKDYESAWIPMFDNLTVPMLKGDYVLSIDLVEGEYTGGVIRLDYADGTCSKEYQQFGGDGSRKVHKITNTSDKILKRINIWNPKGNAIFQYQLEQGTVATPYEPYKSNILTTSEEIVLRSLPNDIKDTLNLTNGEYIQRIGEVVLDGSDDEEWTQSSNNYWNNDDVYGVEVNIPINMKGFEKNSGGKFNLLCDKYTVCWSKREVGLDKEAIGVSNQYRKFTISISKEKLTSPTLEAAKQYLSQNPATIQYELTTPIVKTVDLIPSGTHPSTTPYCWKDGHIQLSSSGLLPNLEYSVVTSRAGQISQNAAMIVKNDKRIFDLEILLAGGLVNTTYQALTLQNQVETGLSKVSLSSEKEPDYLLYHMIMKLIEEKAYKLDDLTEKVSVFYLYEKLSDEQFETIYSALYPFVEDEIVEEPVVEELPEVVEDEVIM